jgi:ComEC/Rec2-related protein
MLLVVRRHFIFIPVPPLLWYTLLYILGIIAGTLEPAFIGLISCLVIMVAVSIYSRKFFRVLIIAGSFFAGFYRFYTTHTTYIQQTEQLAQAPLDIQATVTESEISPKGRIKQSLLLKASYVNQGGRSLEMHPTFRLSLFKSTNLMVGDQIRIHNLRCRPSNNAAYNSYLEKEGITATLFLPYLRYHLVKRPSLSFARWRANQQHRLTKQLASSLSRPTFALMSALYLGKKPDREELYLMIRKQCSAWGIVHYLARSGLHVVLIIFGLSSLLRYFPFHFMVKQGILLLFILLYHLLTWPSISFMRAFITFLLYTACTFQGRSFQTLHILTLTTLIVLVAQPLQLFFLDFQLSFGLTFALAWFNEVSLRINRFHN